MSEDDPMEDVINEDDSEMVTVWAPEPSNDSDELLSSSIDQWINDVKFETTEDVPIPERLVCLLYTSPSPRDGLLSRMPSSA